jgi:hypothetical protein
MGSQTIVFFPEADLPSREGRRRSSGGGWPRPQENPLYNQGRAEGPPVEFLAFPALLFYFLYHELA